MAWSGATNDFARLNRLVVPRVQAVTGAAARRGDALPRGVDPAAPRQPPRRRRPRPLRPARLGTAADAVHAVALRGAAPAGRRPDPVDAAPAADRGRPRGRSSPTRRSHRSSCRRRRPRWSRRPFATTRRSPSPIVIANGVAGLSRQHRARDVLPLVRVVRADPREATCTRGRSARSARKVQRLTAEIEASSDEFQVTAPTDQLAAAASSSTAAARRLLLLGGEGGALLLAFTILAAAALRRDVTDARRRLVWFGARRWQVELHTLAESLSLAAAGTVVGWVVGGGVAALVASRAGSPVGDVVGHALLSRGGLARRGRRRRRRGAAALRDRARAGRSARPARGDAARRRGARCDRRRARRLGARLGRLAAADGRQRDERLPAARARADRLRRGGRRGPPAGADAARARPRRPARPDRAAARRGVARPQPGPRGDRRDLPRREPRPRALRRHLPLDAAARAAATRRASPCRRRSSSRRTSRSSSRCCTARRSRSTPARRRPCCGCPGNVPSGTTFSFLGLPAQRVTSVGGWRRDFASEPLASLAGRDHAQAQRRAARRPPCRPAGSSRCP